MTVENYAQLLQEFARSVAVLDKTRLCIAGLKSSWVNGHRVPAGELYLTLRNTHGALTVDVATLQLDLKPLLDAVISLAEQQHAADHAKAQVLLDDVRNMHVASANELQAHIELFDTLRSAAPALDMTLAQTGI